LLQAAPLFDVLDDFFGVPGVREARQVLNNRILDHIAEQCPALRGAAIAQQKA